MPYRLVAETYDEEASSPFEELRKRDEQEASDTVEEDREEDTQEEEEVAPFTYGDLTPKVEET